MPNRKPKKPATLIDRTLLQVFNDLIERGQIPVFESFAKELGYPNSSQLRGFLNGEIHYSKKRVDYTVKVLSEKYNVSDKYLRTGHGNMYKHNKPYVAKDSIPMLEEHENVLSIGRIRRIKELEEENLRLKGQLTTAPAGGSSLKTDAAYATRQVAFQEVVLDVLAGLSGTTFEELYAKMRIKESDLLRVVSAGGNVYEHRK